MSGWENTGVTAQNSKWTVDIKPCLQYQFKIMVNSNSLDGEGAQLTLPQTVGPASPDQLSASGYIPEAATNFGYDSEDYSANLSWDGADCTSSYYVTYQVWSMAHFFLFTLKEREQLERFFEQNEPCLAKNIEM